VLSQLLHQHQLELNEVEFIALGCTLSNWLQSTENKESELYLAITKLSNDFIKPESMPPYLFEFNNQDLNDMITITKQWITSQNNKIDTCSIHAKAFLKSSLIHRFDLLEKLEISSIN